VLDWKDYQLVLPDESGQYLVTYNEGRRKRHPEDERKIRHYSIRLAYWDAEKQLFDFPSMDAYITDWAKIDAPMYLQQFEKEGLACELNLHKDFLL
jgi:hypothetical protein